MIRTEAVSINTQTQANSTANQGRNFQAVKTTDNKTTLSTYTTAVATIAQVQAGSRKPSQGAGLRRTAEFNVNRFSNPTTSDWKEGEVKEF